ncbi:MAG TPA: hypothetical protein VK554_03045, partial [Bradyrhizobium sp.]|nr:hypothetical protein [Bradyrhizobium sp.]
MGEASSGTSKANFGIEALAPNHPRICHASSNFRTISRNGYRASHGQAAVPVTIVNLSLRIVWRRTANFA